MKDGITFYKDGAVARWHNTRVVIKETKDGNIFIETWIIDGQKGELLPGSKEVRGIRHTCIKFSHKAMRAIVAGYVTLQDNKLLSSEGNDEVSDTTGDDSSTEAGKQERK